MEPIQCRYGHTKSHEREIYVIFGMTEEQRAKSWIWFAWYPVKLEKDGRWVWLEKVIKERWNGTWQCIYHLIGVKNEK